MHLRHTLMTILVPVVVIGGYVLTSMLGGFISDLWDDFAGPFLIMYWIGLGFTNVWDVVRDSVKEARPGVVAATAAVVMFVLLGMLGGLGALIDDPWLFGVVVAPGLDLILPYLHQRFAPAGAPDP